MEDRNDSSRTRSGRWGGRSSFARLLNQDGLSSPTRAALTLSRARTFRSHHPHGNTTTSRCRSHHRFQPSGVPIEVRQSSLSAATCGEN